MAGHPQEPSGAKQTICIRLSPAHITRLDELVERQTTNRSRLIAKLIDRATPKDTP